MTAGRTFEETISSTFLSKLLARKKLLVFYSSINTSGIYQNAEAVAAAICEQIEKLGAEKFCCVITDNSNTMKASWKIVETKHPHISANSCAAHTLNLLIKDILDIAENTKVCKDSDKVIKYVTNHHLVKAKFDEKRKAAKVPHTLTMPVVTRWFSKYDSMQNLLASKYVLQQLCDEEKANFEKIKPVATSQLVMSIVSSNDFWNNLSRVTKLIEYPANIIGNSLNFNIFNCTISPNLIWF